MSSPATSAQRWMLEGLLRQNGSFVVQGVLRSTGPIARSPLEVAFGLVAERHPALRTRFRWQGSADPLQELVDVSHVRVREEDLSTVDGFHGWLEDDRQEGVDPSGTPPYRLTLLCIGSADYRLVWTFPRVILDWSSANQVVAELLAEYELLCVERPVPSDRPSSAERADALEAGDATLAGRRSRSIPEESRRQTLQRTLSGSLSRELAVLAARCGVPITALMRAAWGLVVNDFAAGEGVQFGVLQESRPAGLACLATCIEHRIDRMHIDGQQNVVDYLTQLKQSSDDDSDNPVRTTSEVVEGASRGTELSESVIVFCNPRAGRRCGKGSASRVTCEWVEHFGYAIALSAEVTEPIEFSLSYERARVDRRWAGSVLDRLEASLAALATSEGATLASLWRVPVQEVERLKSLNDTFAPKCEQPSIHAAFERQAALTPQAVAVTFREQSVCYGELDARAGRLAHDLRELGVGSEDRVAVTMNRSIELVVALLGILKAGAAFVPVDPSYPSDRTRVMLEDAAPKVVLTLNCADGVSPVDAHVLSLGDARYASAEPAPQASASVSDDTLAYVIFTSGSTGRPKGVMVEHRNVLNFFQGMDARIGTTPGVWLAVASISFDISILELLWTLCRGFHVVVQQETDRASLLRAADAARTAGKAFTFDDHMLISSQVRRHGVTHFQCTPSMARMLLADPRAADTFAPLEVLLVGGEALPRDLAERLLGLLNKGRLLNMYGPTEATVWCSAAEIEQGADITIGTPMVNTALYVLDVFGNPAPPGVPGELYVGGANVARGYLNRSELTTERFRADRFGLRVAAARHYRTGDVARYRVDGQVEFLGRVDQQVKFRGCRIEMGEIEAALGQHPGVDQCAVVVVGETLEDQKLVANLVLEADAGDAVCIRHLLREFLARSLPEYMLPTEYVVLNHLPLTPNGKVDRKALARASVG